MPIDTVLCLDVSSSMNGGAIQQLQRAVKIFVDGAEQTGRVTGLYENIAMVIFGSSAQLVVPLGKQYNALRAVAGMGYTICFGNGALTFLNKFPFENEWAQ